MQVNSKTANQLRLSDNEFELIIQKIGRTPNFTELCAFSAMWSEHCSYKNSIKWLKTLPNNSEKMLVKAGEENAGVIDIGDGLGVVFKIESHNHPSAIEPFQGAATGVGGIHRDIFTMGARPIAALNSLRFGNLNEKKTQHLLAGVVKGIGHYGNCFGVPTVGGEIYFDECYHTNPLVNAMSVGVIKNNETVSAIATGIGNPVIYVGSATGKDGIGGASFASAEITKDSVQQLPAVQVGDPFQEKKLLEACLEVLKTGWVVGMQDMGAAGIICSTAEMSAKGKSGMKIFLDKVPTRQSNMEAWEILLSESQERMLLVAQKGKEDKIIEVFKKWDLPCSIIGNITDNGLLQFMMHNKEVALIPAFELVLGGGAPQYDKAYKEPAYFLNILKFNPNEIREPENLKSIALQILALPTIASKKWVIEQYDSMVGNVNISIHEPTTASIVSIDGQKALVLTTDCNSRYVYANPYIGAMIAVCEAARNIVCSGGKPLGVTNCLNFGNPNDPEVYYQFVHSVMGMGEACKKLNTPVTGGNVSFYNQNPDGPIFPTPTIGMVGIIENIKNKMTLFFKQTNDIIYVIGKITNNFSSSQYVSKICNIPYSPAPYFNIDEEMMLHTDVEKLINNKLINAANDVSEGGLFITLIEMSIQQKLGFTLHTLKEIRKDAFLFGEGQGRVVVTVAPDKKEEFENFAFNSSVQKIGNVIKNNIFIDDENWGNFSAWQNIYSKAIESYF